MIKKILLVSLLTSFSSISYAQTVSLNKLFEVTQNNFCYQREVYKDIKSSLNIGDNAQLTLLGKSVNATIADTILEVNETENNIKNKLLNAKAPKFSVRDINKTKLKNLYTLEYSITIELQGTPVETIRSMSKSFPGINYDPYNFGGSFVFKSVPQIDYNKAGTMEQLSAMINNSNASSMVFSLSKSSQNSTLINYKCQVVAVSDVSPESFANIVTNKLNQ
jgi:hypothetical protein